MRGQREFLTTFAVLATTPTGTKRRTIYDAKNGMTLPGKLVRGEGGPKSADRSVNEAYDGSGKTYDFYLKAFQRNSIDDRGMRLDSTVHYRRNFNNAFWNGQQMVYGDGDGQIFQRFTKSIDVIGHELTHGVTQYEAELVYQNQPGALNEHFSDVFGSLLKQYVKQQTAKQADWLIGEGMFAPSIHGVALRSMKAPGKAYNDPIIGRDPQPAHMKNYVKTTSDNGGVHINSGIPNRAFYEVAIALGGRAWERAGKIWYRTLIDKIQPLTNFAECAGMTHEVAGTIYGQGSVEQKAVKAGWAVVGVPIGAQLAKAAGAK
ncbi:MAG TPA: M4 family metallopeptidase [Pyrinomonadaceae bacterium]|jgi:Zn-dependent metalloprotease|nr:M4 family metallopeptidase [Pyrinomonadaceae bacterium]